MGRYAKIESGIVTNVIIAEAIDIGGIPGQWIDVTNIIAAPGYSYSGGVFTAPAPVYRKLLSGIEWIETWTDQEWRTLKNAATQDNAVGRTLDKFLDAIRITNSLDLNSTRATQFYNYLEASGFITAQRKAELTQGVL